MLHLQCGISYIVHAFSVRMLHQLRRCPNDYIQAVDSCFYCDACVIHMAPDMSEDFGLEPQVANDFTVLA